MPLPAFLTPKRLQFRIVALFLGLLLVVQLASLLLIGNSISVNARSAVNAEGSSWGYGRELFGAFRHVVTTAEQGATVCFALPTGSRGNDDTPPNPNFVDRTVDA